MSDATATPPQEPGPATAGRTGRRTLVLGIAVSLLLGAAAFAASYLGVVSLPLPGGNGSDPRDAPAPAFVPVPQMVISIGPAEDGRHLRFAAQIETSVDRQAQVALLMPRVLDVLNGYLRAVEPALLERPEALLLLRAQMLRRAALVLGEGMATDLLITEFVID